MVYDVNVLTVFVMAALGEVSAFLANQNVAVFNDGTRPMYGPYLSGQTDRKTLFATSFALSFGLVVGFGVPTSIAGGIIIVHTILLACDIIGAAFKEDKKGMVLSTVCGAAFGVLLMFGMQTIIDIFALLPVNFLDNLSMVGDLVIVLFCVFPALAVAYQCGFKHGCIVLALTMLVKQVVALYGTFTINNVSDSLNSDGMTLLFGIIAMVVYAAKTSKKAEGSTETVFKVFENNIARIKKNMLILCKGMDRFPGMKELGDNTRTAISKVLDIALLVGGMMAANAIAPNLGYIWIVGLYYLNQTAKKPVPAMAIGPIGAITLGIIVNILHLIGLFPVS